MTTTFLEVTEAKSGRKVIISVDIVDLVYKEGTQTMLRVFDSETQKYQLTPVQETYEHLKTKLLW